MTTGDKFPSLEIPLIHSFRTWFESFIVIWANFSKSLSAMAADISSARFGTISSALNLSSSLVSTPLLIPTELGTFFLASSATQINTRISMA